MIVSIPERMLYVRILVPKDIVDSALNILQELGAIHVEVIGKIPEEDKRKLLNDLKRIEELEKLITNIEAYVEIPKLVRVDEYIPPFKLKDKVVTLQKKLKEVANEANTLVHKLRTLEEKLSRYNLLLDVFTKLKDLYGLG
ncbi:MAG TPA: hypothetical protein ENG05_03405, partial [Acidilobales archaeon]|nr:hypothetical protein [Acidilobales archaeon]